MNTPSLAPYDEASARTALDVLDAKIAVFESISLLVHVANALNHPDANDFERMQAFQPWTLLTLVERIALAKRDVANTMQAASERDFRELVDAVFDFSNEHTLLPSEFDSLWSFARTTAFRQFWLQGGFRKTDLSRQHLWFGSVDEFNQAMRDSVGFGADEFIDVFALLWSHFIDPKRPALLTKNDVAEYGKILGDDAMERYLKQTARTLDELRQELTAAYGIGTNREATVEEQVFGQTPLWRFPFVRVGDNVLLLGRPLLWAHARDYVFETLRSRPGNWLGPKLGPHFERYLEQGLKHARVDYRDEAWLRRVLTGDGKVVDFVLLLGNTVLLVDAKAILLPAAMRRAVTRDDVTKQLTSSVVKAVAQGLTVAERLFGAGKPDGIDFTGKRFFMLCVTPSDLYLSVGEDFIDNYAADAYAKFAAPGITKDSFFVASAHEWDNMLGRVADVGIDLAEVLARRAAINSTQKTLLFGQTLFGDGVGVKAPPYLTETANQLLKRLEDRGKAAQAARGPPPSTP